MPKDLIFEHFYTGTGGPAKQKIIAAGNNRAKVIAATPHIYAHQGPV
jgi:hypothetical protein